MSLAESPTERLLGAPTPFFRVAEFGDERRAQFPDAVTRLRERRLTAVVVRGLYDAATMATATARLEAHDPPFLKTTFPEKFRSWFYGRNLNLVGTDPLTYFHQAAEFHDHLEQLLPGEQSLRRRLLAVLSDLDEGRPYLPAPGPEPEWDYMMTTLRGHAEGGYIPPHCDNEQSVRNSYEHLQTLVEDRMYSAVLMIGPPESGGDLQVYDHCVEHAASHEDTGAWAGKVELESLSSARVTLAAGDLVIVDSGRYLHRVTPVEGPTTRWVACSFMAKAVDRDAVYCWG
ncbi:MAG: 2OG-Fe(II) oxygenase [Planctomycetaceae bacterium]|nr:2OG-Fe(II) oxygenase [Planctomycetaceae bacterium]